MISVDSFMAVSFGTLSILGAHTAGVTSIRVSPDGRIFSASLDSTIREWPSGKTLIRFPKIRLYHKLVQPHCLNLALAGNVIVCGMQHGTVNLYGSDGAFLRDLPNPIEKSAYPYNFHTVTANPSDPDIIAGSNGGYLVVWSAKEGKIIWRETSFRLINTVRFLKGGSVLMAHEWDPWIHLWSFDTFQRIRWQTSLMETSANWVTACAAPANSKLDLVIATEDSDESSLIGANLDTAKQLWSGSSEARIHDVAFLPDGRHLLSGGDEGTLELWNLARKGASQKLHLRDAPELAGKIAAPPKRRSGIILTAPVLDEDSYPPSTIHCLDIAPDASFAVLGLVNGLVLRVELRNK